MNVMAREMHSYQDIRELKVRFGASMRKRCYFAGHRLCLILALVAGLTCGLALPGYSWSQPLPNQTEMPLVTNPSWSFTGDLPRHNPSGEGIFVGVPIRCGAPRSLKMSHTF